MTEEVGDGGAVSVVNAHLNIIIVITVMTTVAEHVSNVMIEARRHLSSSPHSVRG